MQYEIVFKVIGGVHVILAFLVLLLLLLNFFLRYKGKLGSKITTATVPRQRRQKCLLVFLNSYREVRKRTEIPL